CSSTIRTARVRTSGENLFVVLLVIGPSSQELGPPTNPARFTRAPMLTPKVLIIDETTGRPISSPTENRAFLPRLAAMLGTTLRQ
ncbi:hypothetical protein, partial [Sphingomonas trueperi]|uniref:hypothetical protein n=3 Tax=Sphingomonas TaxID=13687 RepID=UPI0031D1C67F